MAEHGSGMPRRVASRGGRRRGSLAALVVTVALLAAGCGHPWKLAPWHSYGLASDGFGRAAALHGRTTQQLVDIHHICGGDFYTCTVNVALDIDVVPLNGFDDWTWFDGWVPRPTSDPWYDTAPERLREHLNLFLWLKVANGGYGPPTVCLVLRFVDTPGGATDAVNWVYTNTSNHSYCQQGHGFLT